MKKQFTFFLLSTFFLTACGENSAHRVQLLKSPNPALHQLSVAQFHTKVVANKESFIVGLGINTCKDCLELRETLSRFSLQKEVDTFYVDVSAITSIEYPLLEEATTNLDDTKHYKYPYNSEFPQLFLYEKGFPLVIFQSNYFNNLSKHTEVINNE